jgi:predicted RNA-binding protein with PUA-like domain
MPNYWLVKTEPSTYSYDDLAREATAVWDGVKNPVAIRNLKSMHPGDQVLVYHTGDERAVVGWATVVSAPYPDPKMKDTKLFVIDLKAHRRLPQPVSLAQIKADKTFADLPIVKQGRLSVSPVTAPQWRRVMQLSGAEA